VNSHSTALLDYLAGRAAVAYQGTGQGVHGCDGTAPAATVNAIRAQREAAFPHCGRSAVDVTDLPQEAPHAFAQAVIDVDGY
jgi:hypothetical protein